MPIPNHHAPFSLLRGWKEPVTSVREERLWSNPEDGPFPTPLLSRVICNMLSCFSKLTVNAESWLCAAQCLRQLILQVLHPCKLNVMIPLLAVLQMNMLLLLLLQTKVRVLLHRQEGHFNHLWQGHLLPGKCADNWPLSNTSPLM